MVLNPTAGSSAHAINNGEVVDLGGDDNEMILVTVMLTVLTMLNEVGCNGDGDVVMMMMSTGQQEFLNLVFKLDLFTPQVLHIYLFVYCFDIF